MHVWLYYAGVGGGHRAAAQGLATEFSRQHPGVVLTRIDLGGLMGGRLQNWFENGYTVLIHRAPWLYAVLYEISRLRIVMWGHNMLASFFAVKKIIRLLQQNKPDIIVATYFLISPLVRALKKLRLSIPIAVIVTDPHSAPPIWFYHTELTYVVASEAVKKQALDAGVPAESIYRFSQVVQSHKPSSDSINKVQKEAVLDKKEKTVLVVGGGNGFPHAEEFIEELLRAPYTFQMVVVCGANRTLEEQVIRLASHTTKHVVVYGYVNFLPELLVLADVVITKAGANVLSETMHQKKPIVITHYIWGQEKGNVDFVVENGYGFYEPNKKNTPRVVEACLYDKDLQERIGAAYRKSCFENGAPKIVSHLTSLITQHVGG